MDIKQVDSRLWPFGNETKVFIPEDDCLYIRSDYTPAEYEKPSPQAEPISIDHPSLRPTPPIALGRHFIFVKISTHPHDTTQFKVASE
jgi:hypothetical protein